MDLTKSMRKAKEQLQNAATQITGQIKTLTKSFRVGFGGFIEKAMNPYDGTGIYTYCTNETECPVINCGVYCGIDAGTKNYKERGYYGKWTHNSCDKCEHFKNKGVTYWCSYDCIKDETTGNCGKSK